MCLVVSQYNFTFDTVVPKFKTVQFGNNRNSIWSYLICTRNTIGRDI